MKIFNKKSIFIGITAVIVLFALPTGAQLIPSIQMPNLDMSPTLALSLNPKTPLPNSQITITANLAGITDVNNSNYSWSVNGRYLSADSGTNKNSLAVATGSAGTPYQVALTVLTPQGKNLSETVSFTVSDFDFSWNSDNEAPAGYRAKIIPARYSNISVSVLPAIYSPGTRSLIGSSNLVFNWYLNDKISSGQSGSGKTNFNFKVSGMNYGDISVRLEVKTLDDLVSVIKEISIPTTFPKLLIYAADSGSGRPYGAVLNQLSTAAASLNFAAKSYFFNEPMSELKWQWFINNSAVEPSGNSPWLANLNVQNFSRPMSVQIKSAAASPKVQTETGQSSINLELK